MTIPYRQPTISGIKRDQAKKKKESLSLLTEHLPHLYLRQIEFSHKRLDSPIRILDKYVYFRNKGVGLLPHSGSNLVYRDGSVHLNVYGASPWPRKKSENRSQIIVGVEERERPSGQVRPFGVGAVRDVKGFYPTTKKTQARRPKGGARIRHSYWEASRSPMERKSVSGWVIAIRASKELENRMLANELGGVKGGYPLPFFVFSKSTQFLSEPLPLPHLPPVALRFPILRQTTFVEPLGVSRNANRAFGFSRVVEVNFQLIKFRYLYRVKDGVFY